MKTLRDLPVKNLDNLIAKADELFDNAMNRGDKPDYHDVCMTVALSRGYIANVSLYDSRVIDERCEALAKDASLDDNVDSDLDAYSRRFDCEV